MTIQRGAQVRIVQPTIVGRVSGSYEVDQETGDILIPVVFTAQNGEQHQRHFKLDQVEVVVDANAP